MPKDNLADALAERDAALRHGAPEAAGEAYRPPESPEEDHPFWLAAKIAIAMFVADLICSIIGFTVPTWSLIIAAYLATQPPISSGASAAKKFAAMFVGLVLGIVGAWANQFVPNGAAAITFLIIGGFLATRSSEYLFAAVVGTVITFTAQQGNETVVVEALRAAIMIGIGCLVGPATVWVVETLRARLHRRSA